MTKLRREALTRVIEKQVPQFQKMVENIYEHPSTKDLDPTVLQWLCLSRERFRLEAEGAYIVIADLKKKLATFEKHTNR